MISSSRIQHLVYQTIIYFCGFLLFWEWLRPLEDVTDTGSLTLFVIFTAFCFVISLLRLKWWLAFPLKIAAIMFMIDGLFMSEPMLSPSWFHVIYLHVQLNIELIFNQQWVQMTPLFRSLLFLLLIWLMIYLLYYWFVVAKKMFLFILLTFIYITVLDTFTVYQADGAIVRVFIVSLIALGMSNLSKELDKESIRFRALEKFNVWLLPLIGVILVSTLIGFVSPKTDPQWPDPVPFLTSTAENAGFGEGDGTGGVQKVGYDEDDSNLGGSFVQDYEPVFEALASEKHYWRIESKDRYTGKGWERSTELDFVEQPNGNINFYTFSDLVETEESVAQISYVSDDFIGKLVYPYGINQVSSLNTNIGRYLLDGETGTIELPDVVENHQILYQYPSFALEQLQASGNDDPEEIKELYLQLPDDLPGRIQALAEEETADAQTRYDKVMAIESHFRSGYRYDTKDVAVPEGNQDYVDQFLFETRVGYCDNFSSSMVVMLRSLGIPARWVKGFTGGEELEVQPEGLPGDMAVYQITNANAHSWVEVFFPNIGWVPFEPTQGFSSPVDIYEEASSTDEDPASPQEEEEDTTQEEEQNESAAVNNSNSGFGNISIPGWVWYSLLGLFLLGALAAYITRYHWLSTILICRYQQRDGDKVYQDAYHYLLKVLSHKGIKRNNGQTLRDYATYVDEKLQTTDMSKLTHNYERILYSKNADSAQWKEMSELWKNLIKQSLS